MLNPASVHGQQIKSWRQSFGWSRQEQLYCSARWRGPQWTNALNIKPECVVRSLVCSGRDLVDSLLTGWWWGNQESAWSTFWFQWSEVYGLVGSMQLLPPGGGYSICKTDKDIIVCIPWQGIRTCPEAEELFLDYSSLVFISLPFPYSVQFSCSVVSDSLRANGLQYARLPCPPPVWTCLMELKLLKWLNFLQICPKPSDIFILFYFIFGMWDLRSLTRD